MISEFNSHPITRELNGGEGARNSSGSLTGYGNLFTFIGFPIASDPVSPVRNFLISYVNLKVGAPLPRGKRIHVPITVKIPAMNLFYEVARMPWQTGRSWVHGIETGISGFGHYMYLASRASRSGRGIQTKYQVRAGNFKPTPYMSEIFVKFISRMRKL